MSDSNIGARKTKNIRDHLFILYAVINSVVRGSEECIDIQIYDIEKAFDSLWLDDSFNELYDTLPDQQRNDKISLLYKTNLKNMVAVKTPAGLTKRVDMPCIIQQGGIWGSLLCSNSIDSIGRKCHTSGKYLYKYKKSTEILPLAFVDDLNCISKCGDDSANLNVFLNTQIECKKLTFYTSNSSVSSKCQRMHVGRKNSLCPKLKVHGQEMLDVSEITYLGDRVTADGKNFKNIRDRVRKGTGLVCQILKILQTVRFGNCRIEIALLLRESLLVNGMLTNAEIWYHLQTSETDEIDRVDRSFFYRLMEMPRSVPKAAIYLEFGVLPLSTIIKKRRLNYLHNILKSPETGMLFKVFTIQWLYPCNGDWVVQVKKDLEDFELPGDIQILKNWSKESFKIKVKESAKKYALSILLAKKQQYKKLKYLDYEELATQNYLTRGDLNFEQKKTIFLFRTRMANFGENFRGGRPSTLCPLCSSHVDCQFEALKCPIILQEVEKKMTIDESTKIENIFMENISQSTIKLVMLVTEIRTGMNA